MTQDGRGGGYNAGRSTGAANTPLAKAPTWRAGTRRGSVGGREEQRAVCAVLQGNPITRRGGVAPVVWRLESAPRLAGVRTRWHKDPGRLRGARSMSRRARERGPKTA